MDTGPTKEIRHKAWRGSWIQAQRLLEGLEGWLTPGCEWGGQLGPGSWVRAWEKGLRAPANQSQEGAPSSGSPPGVYTGKGLLSEPCYTLRGLSFLYSQHAPALPHTFTGRPHRMCLKETTHLQPPSWPVLRGCPSQGWGGSCPVPTLSLPPPLSDHLGPGAPGLELGLERLSLRAK